MFPKQVARDTAKALQDYLTYQAVKTIVSQLAETNPPQSIWLSQYSSGKLQDSEAYLQGLMLERKDLVLRILTVREELAEAVVEFLPEMLRNGIRESNTHNRRQLLERLTQTQDSNSTTPVIDTEPESESESEADESAE